MSNQRIEPCLLSSSNTTREVQAHGLLLNNINQVNNIIDFEMPVRLTNTIVLGACSVGAFTYLGVMSEIRRTQIGRFCSIAANVGIGPAEHPDQWLSSHPFQYGSLRYFEDFPLWNQFASNNEQFQGNSKSTRVGHDVWIGRNAVIRQGVEVGHGAIVGANSFVNKNVEPYTIVGGVPAKLIRYRFSEKVIEQLLELQWWDWELNSHKNNLTFSHVEIVIEQIRKLIENKQICRFNPEIKRLQKTEQGREKMMEEYI